MLHKRDVIDTSLENNEGHSCTSEMVMFPWLAMRNDLLAFVKLFITFATECMRRLAGSRVVFEIPTSDWQRENFRYLIRKVAKVPAD